MSPLPRLDALAEAVERRIDYLGLEYREVADRARFSVETLAKVRRGVPIGPRSYRKLESVLGWATYSIDDVLEGGAPTLLPPADQTDVVVTGQRTVDGEDATVSYAALDKRLRKLPKKDQQEIIDYLAQIAEIELRRRRAPGG